MTIWKLHRKYPSIIFITCLKSKSKTFEFRWKEKPFWKLIIHENMKDFVKISFFFKYILANLFIAGKSSTNRTPYFWKEKHYKCFIITFILFYCWCLYFVSYMNVFTLLILGDFWCFLCHWSVFIWEYVAHAFF